MDLLEEEDGEGGVTPFLMVWQRVACVLLRTVLPVMYYR